MHNNWNVYKKGSKRQIIRNGQHISNQVEQYRWTISSWCCTVRSPNTDTVINSDCKSNALLPDWKLATNNRLEYIQSTRTMQSSPSCSKHHPELTSSRASSTCACEIDVWHKEHAALSLNADGRVRRMRHPERQPTTYCLNVSYANARSNITNQQALTAYAAKSTFAFQHELHFLQQP
jgi:hypothetical protein